MFNSIPNHRGLRQAPHIKPLPLPPSCGHADLCEGGQNRSSMGSELFMSSFTHSSHRCSYLLWRDFPWGDVKKYLEYLFTSDKKGTNKPQTSPKTRLVN